MAGQTPTRTAIDSRQPKRLFLSWASRDKRLMDALIGLLRPHLKTLSRVQVEWWEMSHIQTGERFRQDILRRIDECDAAVQLIGPEFLASDFIRDVEIPPFIGPTAVKLALPVGLKRVPLTASLRTTHGIDEHQVFLLDGLFFSELRSAGRERFALELADAIQRRLTGESEWRAL